MSHYSKELIKSIILILFNGEKEDCTGTISRFY